MNSILGFPPLCALSSLFSLISHILAGYDVLSDEFRDLISLILWRCLQCRSLTWFPIFLALVRSHPMERPAVLGKLRNL